MGGLPLKKSISPLAKEEKNTMKKLILGALALSVCLIGSLSASPPFGHRSLQTATLDNSINSIANLAYNGTPADTPFALVLAENIALPEITVAFYSSPPAFASLNVNIAKMVSPSSFYYYITGSHSDSDWNSNASTTYSDDIRLATINRVNSGGIPAAC